MFGHSKSLVRKIGTYMSPTYGALVPDLTHRVHNPPQQHNSEPSYSCSDSGICSSSSGINGSDCGLVLKVSDRVRSQPSDSDQRPVRVPWV